MQAYHSAAVHVELNNILIFFPWNQAETIVVFYYLSAH